MHRRENLISSHLRYISNIKRQRFRDKIISLSYHRLIAREDTCHDTISVTKEQTIKLRMCIIQIVNCLNYRRH